MAPIICLRQLLEKFGQKNKEIIIPKQVFKVYIIKEKIAKDVRKYTNDNMYGGASTSVM